MWMWKLHSRPRPTSWRWLNSSYELQLGTGTIEMQLKPHFAGWLANRADDIVKYYKQNSIEKKNQVIRMNTETIHPKGRPTFNSTADRFVKRIRFTDLFRSSRVKRRQPSVYWCSCSSQAWPTASWRQVGLLKTAVAVLMSCMIWPASAVSCTSLSLIKLSVHCADAPVAASQRLSQTHRLQCVRVWRYYRVRRRFTVYIVTASKVWNLLCPEEFAGICINRRFLYSITKTKVSCLRKNIGVFSDL